MLNLVIHVDTETGIIEVDIIEMVKQFNQRDVF